MYKGFVCSEIIGFGEHLRALEGYHQHCLFHYGGFHVEERFKFLWPQSQQRHVYDVIKRERRWRARRKRVEMALIVAHQSLSPRRINIEFNPRTYRLRGGVRFFGVFFQEDTTSVPFIPRAHSESCLVMVSCYGYEIWLHKLQVVKPILGENTCFSTFYWAARQAQS